MEPLHPPEPEKTAFPSVGRMLNCAAREISVALDTRIAAQVNPELTGMRGMVLGYIIEVTRSGGAVYQRDVETRFHIRRSSVTALLQGMEQGGFINRVSVEQDARLKSLVPTEKGRRCFADLQRSIDAFERELQANIPPGELAALQKSLEKLYANAQEIRNGTNSD